MPQPPFSILSVSRPLPLNFSVGVYVGEVGDFRQLRLLFGGEQLLGIGKPCIKRLLALKDGNLGILSDSVGAKLLFSGLHANED